MLDVILLWLFHHVCTAVVGPLSKFSLFDRPGQRDFRPSQPHTFQLLATNSPHQTPAKLTATNSVQSPARHTTKLTASHVVAQLPSGNSQELLTAFKQPGKLAATHPSNSGTKNGGCTLYSTFATFLKLLKTRRFWKCCTDPLLIMIRIRMPLLIFTRIRMSIPIFTRIRMPLLVFATDPDAVFHFASDPDATYRTDSDSDAARTSHFDSDPNLTQYRR